MGKTEETLEKFPVGVEVRIQKGFAWAGEIGEAISHEDTLLGRRPKVRLDRVGQEVFIMKPEQARVLE